MLKSKLRKPPPMERAGRLIAKLKPAGRHLNSGEFVIAAWRAAVGHRLATRTRAVALHRNTLIVEVEDDLWRKNLSLLRAQLLKNLSDLLDDQAPAAIEFRIGIPRRPPASEPVFTLSPSRLHDEADRIADPVLRRIYLNSRRKAAAS